MSAADYIRHAVFPAAFRLLPAAMDSDEACVMLMAIGYHESRFEYRRQIGGPAVSPFMFELNGIRGVLNHKATRGVIRPILDQMLYGHAAEDSYIALANNDILSTVYARLLLWTHPKALPRIGDEQAALDYYLNLWRPGKPRLDSWAAAYTRGLEMLA